MKRKNIDSVELFFTHALNLVQIKMFMSVATKFWMKTKERLYSTEVRRVSNFEVLVPVVFKLIFMPA